MRRRFTIEEFDLMGSRGVLDEDERVELLDGEICLMSPTGSMHAACVDKLLDLLAQQLPRTARLRVQNPLKLPPRSEPLPDLMVLRYRADYYAAGPPEPDDVLLLIEVSQSSLARDLRIKVPLYARGAVREVWVVDLDARQVLVHRRPVSGVYQDVSVASPGDMLRPALLPELELAVADILI
jgi:Uma2 family endonuclease